MAPNDVGATVATFACLFLLSGLGVTTYGSVKQAQIAASDYRATTCELVRTSGPHRVECSDSSDGVRRLLKLQQCGATFCIYSMRSELTGDSVFDADGDANEDECTLFAGNDRDLNRTDCYAKFEDGSITGLSLQPPDEDSSVPTALIICGCVSICISCCLLCFWRGMGPSAAIEPEIDAEQPRPSICDVGLCEQPRPSTKTVSDGQECIVCVNYDPKDCVRPRRLSNRNSKRKSALGDHYCSACLDHLSECPLCRTRIDLALQCDGAVKSANWIQPPSDPEVPLDLKHDGSLSKGVSETSTAPSETPSICLASTR